MNVREIRRSAARVAAAAAMVAATAVGAAAQWTPERPINIVVPYGAGGGTDAFARAFAAGAEDVLPVPVVIVNRPGSSGLIGAAEVMRARPDGETLMITSAGSFLLTTMLQETEINPVEDFRTIAQIGDLTTSLVVPETSEFETAQDFIDYAKANSGELRWGHTGRGSFHYIAGKAFLDAQGIEAQDVPFQGGGQNRAAVLGEQVDFGFMGVQQLAGFEDQLRVLGLNAPERDPTVETVPTFAEQGLSYAEVSSPILLMAPRGTSDEVVETMENAVREITNTEAFRDIMRQQGNAPAFLPGEEAKARLQRLREAAAPVVEQVRE